MVNKFINKVFRKFRRRMGSGRFMSIYHFFQCKINITLYPSKGKRVKNPLVTFIVPHRDNPKCLEVCIDSIHKYAVGTRYQIIIGDDRSTRRIYKEVAKHAADNVLIYHIQRTKKGHPWILEWLFYRAKSPYVITMDQDALLLSENWKKVLEDIINDEKIIISGMRDSSMVKHNPEMIHPAFCIIDKNRCIERLNSPYFYGRKPNYDSYKISCKEEYHAIFCKALEHSKKSIKYLDIMNTKYGYGVIGFYSNENIKVCFHQFHSSRLHLRGDSYMKTQDEFINDYWNNAISFNLS